MAERSPRDDPDYMKNFKGFLDSDATDACFLEDDRELNLQEASTKINPELCDGAVQEPQVKGSASCSAINEANKKTDSSSSRNRETGRVDKEKDRNDGDDEYDPKESDDESCLYKEFHEIERYYESYFGFSDYGNKTSQLSPNAAPWEPQKTCQNPNRSDSEMSRVMMPPGENAGLVSLVTQPSHQKQITRSGPTMNPQQQLRGPNRGSTSSTSDRNHISQPIGMQSQPSPKAAWKPQNTCQQLPVSNQFPGPAFLDHNYERERLQNTYQQHPVANQMANLVPTPCQIYIPWPHWPMQDQMMHPYQHPVANQQNLHQHPMANQQNLYHHPMANQQNLHQHPMANQQNLYHHSMANQQNIYQHSVADPRMSQSRNAAREQPRSFAIGQNYFNPQQARPEVNQHQMLQRVPQTQQPTQSQGFNTRPSSEQGQDQQQPR